MGKYSIKDLERLSGIKAHTIRVWEQRYSLLQPKRTTTNIRYYDDEQLKYFLNVVTLINHGEKISKVCNLSKNEINDKLQDIYNLWEKKDFHDIYITRLVAAMIELNEGAFNTTFNTCILRLGFEQTFIKVIYPFLNKVGLMWGVDEVLPAQEHFASCLIRQKLIVAIDGIEPPSSKKQWLLFLPEGELHEIGLLLSQYLLRKKGVSTCYMGHNVPFNNIIDLKSQIEPAYLLTFFITTVPTPEIENYIRKLKNTFKQQKILVSGPQELFNGIELPHNCEYISSVPDFQHYIHQISQK